MRGKKNRIITLLLFLVISIEALYSATGGSLDARLLYFPKNVVNNGSVMIELSQAKSLDANSTDVPSDLQNTSRDNLMLFRLRDMLLSGTENAYTTQSSYNWNGITTRQNLYTSSSYSYGQHNRYNNYYDRINNSSGKVYQGTTTTNSTVMTITTSGVFTHENNATATREFSLEAFCTESVLSSAGSGKANYSNNNPIQLGNDDTVLSDGATTHFKRTGNTYELVLPSTPYYVVSTSNYLYYPERIRSFDVAISLDGTNNSLEAGYYTTTITIETTQYYEYEVIIGNITFRKEATVPLTETITIRGYVGETPGTSNGIYTFTVSSASDTYSMNLGLTSQTDANAYEIAKVSFHQMDIINQSLTTSEQDSHATKFNIYISPTSNYEASGSYQFIKMSSENQARSDTNTIYYDLYLKTSQGMKTFSQINSGTSFSGDGVVISTAGTGTKSTTYKLVPEYDYFWIGEGNSSIGGIQTEYREKWDLEIPIYLKISSSSLNKVHDAGMYYSYVYFTLVAN